MQVRHLPRVGTVAEILGAPDWLDETIESIRARERVGVAIARGEVAEHVHQYQQQGGPNPMPEERRAIHAYLTVEAHDVWHTVAEETGISLSGFLEALAIDMREHPPADTGHARWPEIVRTARKIDAQRRRRGAA